MLPNDTADQWDCDGVNEMSVVDITIKGKKAPAPLHLDRNGFGYTPNRETIGSKDQQSAWADAVALKKASYVAALRFASS